MRIPLVAAIIIINLVGGCLIGAQLSSSIYEEVLRSNELPRGLFPNGITNFTLVPDTGRFQLSLNQSCYAKLKSEETDVHYNSNISGTIGHGHISQMLGVSAQDLFLWFPVNSIRVDFPSSGVVHFDVGVVRKQFSLSLFETPPDCTPSASDPPTITASHSILHQKQVEMIASEQEEHGTILKSAS